MIQFTRKIERCPEAPATLTLPWSQRSKSRQRVRLDNGEEAGLFLERGIILRGGDCLATDDNTVVKILAATETVSTVYCQDPLQLARICYHLGNRHVDLEISEHRIRYPHDHVLDAMLQGMGLTAEIEQAPFEPETGAYGEGHGHSHG
ncbi:MAG: urease accessory protein UreE [Proteobacteria bacterium]|nr:urease accessory protein UreE [Pseudomonadota bacterium]MBU1232507.1 urease accessory protein UreE [Pseudomonadota bacterium]MBU1420260.1 urease accessory protein UreE [Pseudomonadota bacterium]MBU1455589.1 urease accessory protein UreE [Pseudomonadota bacterium]